MIRPLLIFLVGVCLYSSHASGQYCYPMINSTTYWEVMIHVEIPGTTLNNISDTVSLTPYTAYVAPTYTAPNYTATLNTGSTYYLKVTLGMYNSEKIAAWIDYNDNYLFEPSEKIGDIDTTLFYQTDSVAFTVPINAVNGVHRLRIRNVEWLGGSSVMDPCSAYNFGESEDYNITIMSGLPTTLQHQNTSSCSMYPNPCLGEFTICRKGPMNQNLEIYNLYGQVVLSQMLNNQVQAIHCQNLPKGIYYVCVGNWVERLRME